MFGLSWGQIIIIVLIGLFVLGPERIPVAVQWTVDGLKKVRNMAQGAQAQLQQEIGPELEELRRQVAELQGLREVQELRNLRDLNPRKMLGNAVFGPESTGKGLTGFLGLDPTLLDAPGPAGSDGPTGADSGPSLEASTPAAVIPDEPAARPVDVHRPASRLPPAAVINAGAVRTNGASNGVHGARANGVTNGAIPTGVDLAKTTVSQRVPAASAPFDPDGT